VKKKLVSIEDKELKRQQRAYCKEVKKQIIVKISKWDKASLDKLLLHLQQLPPAPEKA
jgi:hypothetical protein